MSDIANAILDGSDAVMLSEETTLGLYPVEAVSVMTAVAQQVEQEFPQRKRREGMFDGSEQVVDTVVLLHAVVTVDAKAIVALTESGFTARMIARHRPSQMVYV